MLCHSIEHSPMLGLIRNKMTAIVERISPETNDSIKIHFKVEKTKFGYDLIDQTTNQIHYHVREMEPQFLDGNDYLIEVK